MAKEGEDSYKSFEDFSEEEEHAKQQLQQGRTLNSTMRCAQSLEDTEGLEEVVVLDKSSSKPDHQKNRGRFMAPQQLYEDGLVACSSTPFVYRGHEVSSHCSRGCCGLPWQQPASSSRGNLLGAECMEDELFPASTPWNSSISAGSGFNSASNSGPGLGETMNKLSRPLSSAAAVQKMMLSALKQNASLSCESSISSIVQEVVAREINEHASLALQALHHSKQQ